MRMIKKNSVWIALACTLTASLWMALQEGSVDEALDVPAQNNHAKQDTILKTQPQENKPATFTQSFGIQRMDAEDFPQNIFTDEADENNQVAVSEITAEPPLENPFTYAGKIIEDGETIIFLTDASTNYAVKTGDFMNETWQVLAIMPPNLTLKYIPKKIRIQMDIGAFN